MVSAARNGVQHKDLCSLNPGGTNSQGQKYVSKGRRMVQQVYSTLRLAALSFASMASEWAAEARCRVSRRKAGKSWLCYLISAHCL